MSGMFGFDQMDPEYGYQPSEDELKSKKRKEELAELITQKLSIQEWCNRTFQLATDKGFYENKPTLPERLMLMVTEIAEAMEHYRDGKSPSDIFFHQNGKPDGIPIELADAVIRIFDFAAANGIDFEKAMHLKHEYNKSRPHKHGRNL